MQYVKVPKDEYVELLKYRDIVNYVEEQVHEELNVKPLKDKRAIKVIKKLHKEALEGKRRTISDEEFTNKYRHLL